MAAGSWVQHDKAIEYAGDGTIDYDGDTFSMFLLLSTSNIATLSIDAYSTVTNEHANANGYTTGGDTIDSPTWVEASGVVTFDCADEVFSPSGGSIIARFAAIKDDTVSSPVVDPVICHCVLDASSPEADVTATTGNTLTITIHANGVFTYARA